MQYNCNLIGYFIRDLHWLSSTETFHSEKCIGEIYVLVKPTKVG